MESRSLVPVLGGGQTSHRDHVRSGLDAWRMVFDGRFKLVRQEYGRGEAATMLFDLTNDPEERHDTAAALPNEVARLLPLLHAAGTSR